MRKNQADAARLGRKNWHDFWAQYIAPSKLNAGSLGSIVRSFKAAVSRDFRSNSDKIRVWQMNYYEHIIRSEQSLNYIRYHVATNPERWGEDVLRDEASAQKWYSRFAKN